MSAPDPSPRHPTLLVTGASGHLGRLTADALIERADPADLVLVSRRPEQLAGYAARDVEIRHGDFDAPESLDAAFAGVRRLLLISTDAVGRREAQHRNAVEAAVRAGVEHVVYTSVVNAVGANPSAVAPEHAATERMLRESGIAFTFLRESIYAEFQVPEARAALQSGRLVTNAGAGRIAYMSRVDLAAVAASVLSTPGHEGATYDVTGPELHDPEALAALYGAIGGREIEAVALDDAAYSAWLVEQAGLPDEMASVVATTGRAIREGFFDSVSTSVDDLAGRPAIPLRDVIEAGLRTDAASAA